MTKIVMDSCCEYNEEMLVGMNYASVPFKITIDGVEYVDDENLEITFFKEKMRATKDVIRTACPSPQEYLDKFEGEEVYVITITGELSGSYQSAMIAKEMYMRENKNAKVHVFNTMSAVAGETGVLLFLRDKIKAGKDFDTIVEETEDFIRRSTTVINFSNLTNLVKNGRIPKIAGKLSKALKIKLIAIARGGRIVPVSIERGIKRSVNAMVNKATELCDKTLKSAIVISEFDAKEMAEEVKGKLRAIFPERIIEVTTMKALSLVYAEEGGLVIHL